MLPSIEIFLKSALGCGLALALAASFDTACAGPVKMLYTFDKSGHHGATPNTGVISDSAGNLYGTTEAGGPGCEPSGCGVVFRLAPDGTETVLYEFGGSISVLPYGLVRDKDGNLYGTTEFGGDPNCGNQNVGCGMVYKLAPDGTETMLHAFEGGSADGAYPSSALLRDRHGNLYGTTWQGGQGCGSTGCGVVYKIAPNGSNKVLYAFCSQSQCVDGQSPESTLIADNADNLYGTTTEGGLYEYGVVFKLANNGTETVLYNFCTQYFGCSDGANPAAGVTMDSEGNLYGTTMQGGGGSGAVYKLAPDGTETVLHIFGFGDGGYPESGVIVDRAGDVYGTLYQFDAPACGNKGGVVYRIAPDGSEKLYCVRSEMGAAGVIDRNGYLYGTGTDEDKRKGLGFVFAVKK
jgi:uncharacterized repeat protein (TIGR03803 family)